MDLTGLADFWETQEISFTSILKCTKNIDPEELKRTLTRHHAQMIMIGGGRYPIKFTPSSSHGKPSSASKRRSFTSSTSDEEDYEPSAKTSSGKHKMSSSSTSTPAKPKSSTKRNKTPTPSSTRGFNSSGRMKPAGASTLFKNKSLTYRKSPGSLKVYDVIDLSSVPDSEFEEAQEGTDIDDSDIKYKKQLPIRKGVATRKVTPSKKNKASASTSAAAKKILTGVTDESDEDSFTSTKKSESSGGQKGGKAGMKKLKSKAEIERATAAIPGIKANIAILEKQIADIRATLDLTTNFLARKPLLDKIDSLKAVIAANKTAIEEASGLRKEKSMAATVEDAPEDESDTLFLNNTPTKSSAAKRRCGGL
ncbi:hypothetical protein IFR05_001107 [Cadophora sp. M221]|nr:hypothetical protein IFR05_001107 [Cadophora sp. M221]